MPRTLFARRAAHGPELYRFAQRALGDAGAAQDVVQDTFLRAWRAADRYDPQLASLRVWLFSIARNVIIDHHRARQARPWLGELAGEPAADAPAAVDAIDELMRSWVVEEAMRCLNEDHRRALAETALAGRPYDEVAAELGIPVSTLRSRVFYGLKALRVVMEEMEVTS